VKIEKQLDTRAGRLNNFEGFKVIANPYLLDKSPAKPHRKIRIHRKWLKRYGYKLEPSRKIRIEVRDRILMVHPIMLKRIQKYINTKRGDSL
jgi:hypothetical protein